MLESGQSEDEAEALLKPVRQRLHDPQLWKHLGQGLAVLVAPGRVHWIRTEVPLTRQVSLGTRFRLAPLILALPRVERFFVLALSINEVRLVEVNPGLAQRVHPEGMPASMDDALGLDQVDTGLHVHSAGPRTQGRKAGIIHGHGSDDEERRRTSDLQAYLRIVAGKVRETVGKNPLVLASVGDHFPIFRGAYGSDELITGIRGNPETLTDAELADAARDLLADREAEQTSRLLEKYHEFPDRRRVAEDPCSIVTEAVQGRVDTLFAREDRTLWGTFETDCGRAELHAEREPGDDDLVDLAVTQTLLHGGDVLAVPAAEMPGTGSLAAVLRYRAKTAA